MTTLLRLMSKDAQLLIKNGQVDQRLLAPSDSHISVAYIGDATSAKPARSRARIILPPVNMVSQESLFIEPPTEARKVLGVSEHASRRVIRAAYRRLMNKHHPDKHVRAPRGEREWHGRWAVALNKAFEELCPLMTSTPS